MDKNTLLRLVNPVLAILMLNQPFSGLLYSVTDWDLFESLYVGGGVLLVFLAVVHLMLNWRWVTTNFFKNSKKQKN